MDNNISFKVDKLTVSISSNRDELGKIGASDVGRAIKDLLQKKDSINIIFASAPSQIDVLDNLRIDPEIEWSRINAFHMDEYIGLPSNASQSFGNYLRVRFFSKLAFRNVYYIDGMTDDPQKECDRYARLLEKNPVDISLVGIGENGHLAFVDPYIADFNDPLLVKINHQLDQVCRLQQVKDGWFTSESEVPQKAITLTLPALMSADDVFAFVPGSTKKEIIKTVLEGPICVDCPGTIIRNHPAARLYLDRESAELLSLVTH